MNGIPHLTKHDERVIHSSVRPAGEPAKPLTRWHIFATLLLVTIVCFSIYSNFEPLNRGLKDSTAGELFSEFTPLVKFVLQHQWEIYTYSLIAIIIGNMVAIKNRERLIAKLYWHIVKLQKTHHDHTD